MPALSPLHATFLFCLSHSSHHPLSSRPSALPSPPLSFSPFFFSLLIAPFLFFLTQSPLLSVTFWFSPQNLFFPFFSSFPSAHLPTWLLFAPVRLLHCYPLWGCLADNVGSSWSDCWLYCCTGTWDVGVLCVRREPASRKTALWSTLQLGGLFPLNSQEHTHTRDPVLMPRPPPPPIMLNHLLLLFLSFLSPMSAPRAAHTQTQTHVSGPHIFLTSFRPHFLPVCLAPSLDTLLISILNVVLLRFRVYVQVKAQVRAKSTSVFSRASLVQNSWGFNRSQLFGLDSLILFYFLLIIAMKRIWFWWGMSALLLHFLSP